MGYIEKLRQKNQNPVINWKCHISFIFRMRKRCRFDMGTAISLFKQITDEFLLSPRSPFTLGLRSCMDTSSGFQLSLKNLFSLKLKICMNTISGFLMSLKGPVFLELQNCMNNLFGFPLNQKKSFFLELQNCMEYTFWISTGSLSVRRNPTGASLWLPHNNAGRPQWIRKNRMWETHPAVFVGVDGFEPPTLCL